MTLRGTSYWLPMLLAIAVSLPGLGVGFFCWDDLVQIASLQKLHATDAAPFNLWRFYSGDPNDWAALVREGMIPWWREVASWNLFRPVSSVTLVLDHALFGTSGPGYHFMSSVWFAALVGLVVVLYRKHLDARTALIAGLAFAIDAIHWEVIGVVCCRHYLIAALFGTAALILYVKWRQEHSRIALGGCLVGLLAGMLSGESAAQILGYIIAYEMVVARDGLRNRAISLAMLATVVPVYYVLFQTLGGAPDFGAPSLTNPVERPIAFLLSLAVTAPGAIIKLLGTHWSLSGTPIALVAAAAVILLCIVAIAVRRILSNAPEEATTVRWMALGAAVSLLPVGTAPYMGTRLLLIPSIGVAVVVAMILRHGWRVVRVTGAPRLARVCVAVALAIAALHVTVSPAVMAYNFHYTKQFGLEMSQPYVDVVRDLDCPKSARNIVALVVPWQFGNLQQEIVIRGLSELSWWQLSPLPTKHRLARTGERSFELSSAAAPNIRIPDRTVQMRALTVEPLPRAADGRVRIAFTLDPAMDSSSYCFASWSTTALRRVNLPPIGSSIELNFVFDEPVNRYSFRNFW